MTKDQANRPLRLGKLRGGTLRPWQTKLYGPTAKRPKPRVVFKDLQTGEWRYLTGDDLDEANAIFEKAERWLDAGVVLTPDKEPTAEGRRDLAALGQRLLARMEDDGVRRRTLQDWDRIIRCHIAPVIGARSVVEWDGDDCQKVLRRSRKAGLAPVSVQDIGSVMVALVREAHRKPRWLPLEENPMEGVRYRAKARHQGQVASFIPLNDRPATPGVRDLCAALYWRGRRQGRWWYSLMGLIAGFAGLRWSELAGLRPCDYDATRRLLIVGSSIEQPDHGPQVRERTKSDKIREVPVTGTAHRWLERRCAEVTALPPGTGGWAGGGPQGLLFPGPDGGPWRRSTWRRGVFIPAARAAGWEMVNESMSASGLMRGGKPRLPWRNLRHHAATWLHHEAGLPWEEVSHILGHHNVAFTIATYVRRGADTENEVRARLSRF